MAWAAAAAGVASNVVGGILGNKASKDAQARADAALAAARAEIEKVGAPPDISKAIILDKLQQAGVLTPEMEQQIDIGVSKMAEYQEAPEARKAQAQALELMSQAAKEGVTAQDRADLNAIRTKAARDAEARRQQLLQNLQARGIAGSGAELASQLAAQQQEYETASGEGDRIAAQAQARALQAMSQAGQMGTQLRSSDLQNAQAVRNAADEFRKFDVANQVSQQSRNVSSRNQAQASNLSEKQRIQDANTQAANQEKYAQQQRAMQYWDSKLKYAQALANPYQQQAATAEQRGQQQANMYTGLGNSIGSAFAAWANKSSNNKNEP